MGHQNTKSSSVATLARDFTLGFADGLTVPFALTAGMSSVLGRSDAVVLAGLAEVCAGSISMGIGGFLAMRDTCREEQQRRRSKEVDEGDEEGAELLMRNEDERCGDNDEKARSGLDEHLRLGDEAAVRRYLRPLNLSESAIQDVLASMQHQRQRNEETQSPRLSSDSTARNSEDDEQLITTMETNATHQLEPIQHSKSRRSWMSTTVLAPILSGLTIALGYIIGGLIPLFPYLFTDAIEVGTRWSIGLCMLALFVFGAGKAWILDGVTGNSEVGDGRENRRRRIRRCIFEGLQTLILGMVAAGAAVLCVRVVDKDGTISAGSGA